MEGKIKDENEKGLIPRAVDEIFKAMKDFKNNGWEFQISCTFQEIYLETIRDLIQKENFKGNHNKNEYEPTCLLIEDLSDIDYVMEQAKKN